MISRRKFLILFISSIALISYPNLIKPKISNSKNNYFNENIASQIIEFNKKRTYELKNNLNLEIKKDHEEGRTIWLKKNIYTFAELYQFE